MQRIEESAKRLQLNLERVDMRLVEKSLSISILSIPRGVSREVFELDMQNIPWDLPEGELDATYGELDVEIERTEQDIFLRGTISADFQVPCALCLIPVKFHIAEDFERMYSWDCEMLTDEGVEPVSHNDGSISILDPVREAIIFALPKLPLCTESCKGLCVQCGNDLNKGNCKHT